ncbi:MAG TPA: DUF1844 domain-containing protein [Firmicutes bacterium]|nr:DUF1844 domain-containing protein [Bacillota bacterium]
MSDEDAKKGILEEAVKSAMAMGIVDTIRSFVAILATKAWQSMGLTINPSTGKIEKNLEDSRLAIDALAGLIELIGPRIPGEELRQYRALLQDLQLNFVNQSQ